MILVHTVSELHDTLSTLHATEKSVGFVPTMGALHAGHLSLVNKSIADNEITVVSIFVNPTQFNDKQDFDKYPRNIEQDALMLAKTGLDIVFVPSVEEVYPNQDTRVFDFGDLDKVMEGKHRLGHFNGVAQVVSRLFELVKPNKAYFGEKDFQQLAIIRAMVEQLQLSIQIVGMPILREESGLAMSSRNERLSQDERVLASVIYTTLSESLASHTTRTVQETVLFVTETLNVQKGLHVEYFEIVDAFTLQAISSWQDSTYAVGCIAVFCGEVRLIDNITYFLKQ